MPWRFFRGAVFCRKFRDGDSQPKKNEFSLPRQPRRGIFFKKTAKEHKCDLAGFLCREAMFWQGHTLALQVKSN